MGNTIVLISGTGGHRGFPDAVDEIGFVDAGRRPSISSSLIARPLSEVEASAVDFIRTGIDGLDRVLGGGLARRHAILLAGAKGGGKSSLSLQALDGPTRAGRKCLFASGEEGEDAVRRRAERLGVTLDVMIAGTSDLNAVLDLAERDRIDVVALDSAQRFTVRGIRGVAGSDRQLKALGRAVSDFAHSHDLAIVVLCQATKGASQVAAGPAGVAHDLDAVFALKKFAGGRRLFVSDGKNRVARVDGARWRCRMDEVGRIVDRERATRGRPSSTELPRRAQGRGRPKGSPSTRTSRGAS